MVKQEEFPSVALFYLADQKRIQSKRSWIGEERTFPPVLLVDYDVEMVEVVFSDARLLAGFLGRMPSNSAVIVSFFQGKNRFSTERQNT